ncbi:LOW QUALITY PROTEIN: hypothetical protein PanWU01x14_180930 [Parasponia andersonii]|uniref:Uncharacterized protein n=1 Tax=Parasponia andersonii TaxID=3476 RepID=A0A2P5C686_PARAD|nr:LOW QUALITY PROTEIN: hypothetical protein PanWU01x14_180930 [Parasponia andersonii]
MLNGYTYSHSIVFHYKSFFNIKKNFKYYKNLVRINKRTALATEKCVQNDADIDQKRGRDEDHKRDYGGVGVRAATTEGPELDLDDVDQSQHEESAAADGADAGDEHPDPEDGPVDPAEEPGRVVGGAPADPNPLLEPDGDQAGEEEGAEGVDVEGDEVFGDLGAWVAARVVDERVIRVGRVPGQPEEDG